MVLVSYLFNLRQGSSTHLFVTMTCQHLFLVTMACQAVYACGKGLFFAAGPRPSSRSISRGFSRTCGAACERSAATSPLALTSTCGPSWNLLVLQENHYRPASFILIACLVPYLFCCSRWLQRQHEVKSHAFHAQHDQHSAVLTKLANITQKPRLAKQGQSNTCRLHAVYQAREYGRRS